MHFPQNLFLFVYGTLRPVFNEPEGTLDSNFFHNDYRYFGEAKTRGRLYDLGDYPAMTPALNPDEWVQGDLLWLTFPKVLDKLDRYEEATPRRGRQQLYERRLADVWWKSEQKKAWVYFYLQPVSEDLRLQEGIWNGKK